MLQFDTVCNVCMISCMVESGANHSFVTKAITETIGEKTEHGKTLVVTLADGSVIQSTDIVHLLLGM